VNSYITEDHIQALVASGKFTRAEAIRFLEADFKREERAWREMEAERAMKPRGTRAQLTTSADRKSLQAELSRAGLPTSLLQDFIAAGLSDSKAARLFLASADRNPRGQFAGLALVRLTSSLQARACYSQRNA
jgi:hypothetical protein